MTALRSVPGYAYLRSVPGQPFQVRADTIIHPTLSDAKRHWQYGTVLCEVELVWDDKHQLGIFQNVNPGRASCVGRRNDYWHAYIALLDARRRDGQAVIRFLHWRPTSGQDILHNITDHLTIKAPVGKAA